MTYATTPITTDPRMVHRTIAVSSDVGDPFVLISANPPPITRAANATTKKTSETLRAVLLRNRDCDLSGRRDPLVVGLRPPVTSSPP
jgi:hypothetical protein